MTNVLDVQIACDENTAQIPTKTDLEHWFNTVLSRHNVDDHEMTIRFVDSNESAELNHTYRKKDSPTNVLSFPFDTPDGIDIPLLGDLVICVPVILQEAQQQNKNTHAHFAHMIVHGTLHLLGYDHIEEDEANKMESLEIELLANLGIDDPYQEH